MEAKHMRHNSCTQILDTILAFIGSFGILQDFLGQALLAAKGIISLSLIPRWVVELG
jgi:hypothetical protein